MLDNQVGIIDDIVEIDDDDIEELEDYEIEDVED